MENESNKHGNRKKGRSNGKNCRRKGIEKNRKIRKVKGGKLKRKKKKKKKNKKQRKEGEGKKKKRKRGRVSEKRTFAGTFLKSGSIS